MRLAYVTRQFPCARIGEAFLAAEVRELSRHCEELHVVPIRPASRDSAFSDLGAIEVCVPALSFETLVAAAQEFLTHPLAAARVLWTIFASRYSLSAKAKNVACFPKGLAVARYVREHRLQHIHAHWLTTPATVAFIASGMTGVPWSCTAHAHDIFSDNLVARKALSSRFIRAIATRNGRHLQILAGARAAPVHVVHLGVAIPNAPAPAAPPARPLQVLCAARLDAIKGHEDLLQALVLLAERGIPFHCEFAGDGPLLRTLAGRIEQLGLQTSVTLRGLVEHDALLREIQTGQFDVQVLASVEHEKAGAHEGIPVSLIEAMAAQIPCVSTSTGCIPELIVDGTGVLVPQRDPGALAGALAALSERPGARHDLGSAARRHVIESFNAAQTARALYDLVCEASAEAGVRENPLPNEAVRPPSIPIANANCSTGK